MKFVYLKLYKRMSVIQEVGEIGFNRTINSIIWRIRSSTDLPQGVYTRILNPLCHYKVRFTGIRLSFDTSLPNLRENLLFWKNTSIIVGILNEKGNEIYCSSGSWDMFFRNFIAKQVTPWPRDSFRLFCEIQRSAIDIYSEKKLKNATKSEASASNTDKSTDQFVLNVSSKPEEDNDVTTTKSEASATSTDKSTDQFVVNVSSKPEENNDVTVVAEISAVDKEAQHEDFKCLQKLSENLKELYVGSKDFDLTLKVKDKEFKAHKNILGARTPVFNAMLSHNFAESKEGIITIEDCEPEVFDDFLCFIYAGKVENLCSDNVCGLYYTADKYDLPELKDKCIHFLKKSMSPETICDVISLATKHSESELLNLAVQFFVDNMEKILVTVSWQLYLKENPIQANELYIKALNRGFTR